MGKLFVTLFAFLPALPTGRQAAGRLAPYDARFQLGQGLRRDSFLAKVPGPCPDTASGNTPPLQAGFFAKIAHFPLLKLAPP